MIPRSFLSCVEGMAILTTHYANCIKRISNWPTLGHVVLTYVKERYVEQTKTHTNLPVMPVLVTPESIIQEAVIQISEWNINLRKN